MRDDPAAGRNVPVSVRIVEQAVGKRQQQPIHTRADQPRHRRPGGKGFGREPDDLFVHGRESSRAPLSLLYPLFYQCFAHDLPAAALNRRTARPMSFDINRNTISADFGPIHHDNHSSVGAL